MILPRIVPLSAAAVAALGGVLIYVDDRAVGEAVAAAPIVALLAGVVAFAIAARREPIPDPAAGSGLPPRIPDGLKIPTSSRRGLRLASVVCVVTTTIYAVLGYNPLVLAGWLSALALASRALWPECRTPTPRNRLVPGEYWFLAATMLGFALLVLPYLSTLPYEFSTDEIYSTATVRDFVDGTEKDPLGLVAWWGLPALYFALTAIMGHIFGTSIEAVRMVTALTAIATIVPFYMWIRTLHGRNTATIATLMLALAHAFIGWGRIALHQNSPVLLLSIAMALLAIGMRDCCPLKILWGGVTLGLAFHSYPSGQIIVFIWVVALGATVVLRSVSWKTVAPIAVLSGLGFLLAVAPMIVNMVGSWEAFAARAQAVAISNPAAIDLMGQHLGLTDHTMILRENTVRSLLSFNGAYPYVTYFNPGHGFVDPATGVLLWLGVAFALTRLRNFGLLLSVVGFGAVYAVGFLTEGAPVHGRLLVALPFVTVLAAEALGSLGRAIAPGGGARLLRRRLAGAFIFAFAILNLAIFQNYVHNQVSRARSDAATAIGRTLGVGVEMTNPLGRFFGQEATWPPGTLAVLITNDDYPVFRWADEVEWRMWMAFFSDESRVQILPDVQSFVDVPASTFVNGFWTGAIVFMRREIWERDRDALLAAYPDLRHEPLTSNRQLITVHLSR
jgi:hypothetical protein